VVNTKFCDWSQVINLFFPLTEVLIIGVVIAVIDELESPPPPVFDATGVTETELEAVPDP
jgi:hypothetical protein